MPGRETVVLCLCQVHVTGELTVLAIRILWSCQDVESSTSFESFPIAPSRLAPLQQFLMPVLPLVLFVSWPHRNPSK